MRHGEHDAVAAEVRSWYRKAHPETGYTAERTWFGYFRGNTQAPFHAATVTSLDAGQVPRFAGAVREHFGAVSVTIQVADEAITDDLDAALVAHGFERGATTTYLVHVGDFPDVTEPPGYAFERVGADGLEEFSRVKLQGFASSEDDPAPDDMEREIAFRKAELGDPNGFAIGRIDGEPAGITAWYGGGDALIFLVATRLPFRSMGVASAGIRRVLDDELANGSRSVLINGDVDDHPVDIYRRLGFTDEVYRERRYTLDLTTG